MQLASIKNAVLDGFMRTLGSMTARQERLVAVDIRPGSATYGEWVGVTLDAINHHMFYIPPGFAHGFYVTSPDAVVTYKCTTPYQPEAESGIRWDDATLNISWPWVEGAPLVVSEKDKQWGGFIHVG